MFARQPEILDYLRHCVREYRLEEHLYFGVRFDSGEWDETAKEWRVKIGAPDGESVAGTEIRASYVVLGMGPLHRPLLPDVPGVGDFGTSPA